MAGQRERGQQRSARNNNKRLLRSREQMSRREGGESDAQPRSQLSVGGAGEDGSVYEMDKLKLRAATVRVSLVRQAQRKYGHTRTSSSGVWLYDRSILRVFKNVCVRTLLTVSVHISPLPWGWGGRLGSLLKALRASGRREGRSHRRDPHAANRACNRQCMASRAAFLAPMGTTTGQFCNSGNTNEAGEGYLHSFF